MTSAEAARESAIDLAWSLWAELGVSTWARGHQDWSIEVEPLMVLTAFVGRSDPRLMRESIDWCAQFKDFISINQFRHVVTAARLPFPGEVNDYSATVANHTKRNMPGADVGEAYSLKRSHASRLPDFSSPSLVQLRLRALLGVSARAEVLRVLVTHPARTWTIADMAKHVAYTRRHVATALDRLQIAGVVYATGSDGKHEYVVRASEELAALSGPRPRVVPRWGAVVGALVTILKALTQVTSPALSMPESELSRQLRLLQPHLHDAGILLPELRREALVEDFVEWGAGIFTSFAAGNPRYLPTASSHGVNG